MKENSIISLRECSEQILKTDLIIFILLMALIISYFADLPNNLNWNMTEIDKKSI